MGSFSARFDSTISSLAWVWNGIVLPKTELLVNPNESFPSGSFWPFPHSASPARLWESPLSLFCPHNSSPEPRFQSITFQRITNCFPFVRSQLKQIPLFKLQPGTYLPSSLVSPVKYSLWQPSHWQFCWKFIFVFITHLYFSSLYYPKSEGTWILGHKDGAPWMALPGVTVRPEAVCSRRLPEQDRKLAGVSDLTAGLLCLRYMGQKQMIFPLPEWTNDWTPCAYQMREWINRRKQQSGTDYD